MGDTYRVNDKSLYIDIQIPSHNSDFHMIRCKCQIKLFKNSIDAGLWVMVINFHIRYASIIEKNDLCGLLLTTCLLFITSSLLLSILSVVGTDQKKKFLLVNKFRLLAKFMISSL